MTPDPLRPGWLARQLENVKREIEQAPSWMYADETRKTTDAKER